MESVLESILINTYNQDATLRAQAEQALNQFLLSSGALLALLNFIGNTNNHRELRQATGIVIKNKMRAFWSDDAQNALKTDPQEKEQVKTRIVEILLVEVDNSIRGILAEAIRIISETDFPQNWPALIPTLLEYIQSTDVLKMYNSLLALRKVAKRYEYKQKEDREPLNAIVQVTFPCLQQLMTHVSQHNSIEAAQVMKMCLKIFWSATMYQLPQVSGVDVNLWFQLVGQVIDKPLPEASEGVEPLGQPTDREERAAWPWWKLKKWAGRIASQFIQRYGNPRYANAEYKEFAEFFRNNTAGQLLGPVMNLLAAKSRGSFVTDEVHRMCIGYVASCVEMSPTYKLIKPHLSFVLTGIVFPTLCLTDADLELFNDEPVEFVRKVHDPLGDWLSPLIAATNLLQMLARYRQKDTLPMLLPYVQGVLVEYVQAPPEQRDYRRKDGALVAIAVLAKILKDSKTYESLLHPFLEAHVIPEFQSPVAYIRSRACWVIEYFHELNWSEHEGRNLQAVLRGLINGLRDPALPVQAAAACSLRLLIAADGATDLLRPMLGEIVAEYFRIMEEVENESVLSALQAIILKFGEEVASMAPMMTTQLVVLFNRYLAAGSEDEEATFNAVQCLDTIDSVLEAVQDHPEILIQLEPVVQPMILRLLVEGDDLFEYLDSAVHMISNFTYYSDTISPHMWSLCGPLLAVLQEWAIDYIAEIMVPILNFITKDVLTFFQGVHNGKPFVVMILSVVEAAFGNDESYNGKDSGCAATILTCLITTSRSAPGSLSAYIPQIISIILNKLKDVKSIALRNRLLETIMACFYYDAELTLSFLQTLPEAATIVTTLFTVLFDNLQDMDRDFTQRLIVLSFCALLSVSPAKLPEIVRNNFPSMFQQIIRELVLIEEEAAKESQEGEEGGGDDDDDGIFGGDDDEEEDDGIEVDDDDEDEGEDDDENFDDSDPKAAAKRRAKALHVPEGGYDEDQDCLNAEDEAYREALEQMGRDQEEKAAKYAGGDLLMDDESMEDFTFTSPIENMNIVQHFLDTMNSLEAQGGGALTASLQASLDAEDKQRLQELIANAHERATNSS